MSNIVFVTLSDRSEGECAGVALVWGGAVLSGQFYCWGLEAETGDRFINELLSFICSKEDWKERETYFGSELLR